MKLTTIFTTLIVAFACSVQLQADITIDNYTAGSTLTQFGTGTTGNTTMSASILGGQRAESITVTAQGGNEFFGTLGFSGNMDVAQGSLDQIFGGVTYSNFSNLDMTEGGLNDSFELGFLSSDFNGPIDGVVSLTVDDGITSSTLFVTVPPSSSLPQNELVNFSSFGGVDFSSVDSISLNFNFENHAGRDFELGLFSATTSSVPEPTTGMLLCGLGSMLLLRRQRRA